MSDDRVIIFDTTLRDGEQSPGISLDVGEKLEIAEQLARVNVDVIEAGFPVASDGDFEAVQAIAREHGGHDFQWATKPEERTQLWQARHDAYFACLQIRPGSRAVSTDVCVPISRLAECVHETMEDVKSYFAPVPLLGHIGDGNFHLMLLVDPAKPEETEIAKQFNKRLVERALRLEGTCTGEHGIGMGKMDSMRMELGEDVIDVMRDIKRALDPDNLMNPGKVVPAPL